MGERFFLMVQHEEYGLYISPFNDDMIIEPNYLHVQHNPINKVKLIFIK